MPKTNFINEGFYHTTDLVHDPFNVLQTYNKTVDDLINLCGGVPSNEVEFLIIDASSISEFSIKVVIQTNLYEMSRIIDFEDKVIVNSGLYVFKIENWIGTTLFLNQVKEARTQGFDHFTVVAEGPDRDKDYTGHYRWGRVGYTMSTPDKEDFDIWVCGVKRFDATLGELLLSEDGCYLWKIAGFSWAGKFYLHDESECMNYLRDYLERKGIKFTF